jgi:hypothetical protein
LSKGTRFIMVVALFLAGCGQPSQTVVVVLASHGAVPDGVSSARFTVEEIRVRVQVPGQPPAWHAVLSDEEGGRTFDLLTLGDGRLAAERDVPAGTVDAISVSFDTDEAAEPGTLHLAKGASTVEEFPLPATQRDALHLEIDWDATASLGRDPAGAWVLHPLASARVRP